MFQLSRLVSAKPATSLFASTLLKSQITSSVRMYSNKLTYGSFPCAHGPEPIMRYTKNHEWICAHKDNVAFVGITKFAVEALGDTTYVEVNEPPADVEADDSIGSVESVKSASDVYAPVSGKVTARNDELISNPALLNEDPMGKAWLAEMQISNAADLENLLTLEKYTELIESEAEH